MVVFFDPVRFSNAAAFAGFDTSPRALAGGGDFVFLESGEGFAGGAFAGLVIVDELGGFFDIIGEVEEIHIVLADAVKLVAHGGTDPVEQAAPEIFADEDDGKRDDFKGLDEGERFEELIHGAETAGEDDETGGVFDEHDFANKEVAEVEFDILVGVGILLEGEGDVEADAGAAGFVCSLVGGFHDAGAAAGDDGEVPGDELAAAFDGLDIFRGIGGGAGRAEDADGGAEAGEDFEGLDELAHDTKDAPGLVAEFFLVVDGLVGVLHGDRS